MGTNQNTTKRRTVRPPLAITRPKIPRGKRLTVTMIGGLKDFDVAYDVADPECRGLLLHIPAKLADESPGAKAWQWRYRFDRKRKKLTVGKFPEVSQREAHDQVRKWRGYLEKGIDPAKTNQSKSRAPLVAVKQPDGTPVDPHSVEALVADFMERHVKPDRKSWRDVQRILDVEVLKHWRTRDARTIEPDDVLKLLEDIADRGSRTMANRVATTVSQLFRWGIHKRVIKTSPVQLLFKPGGKETPRDRALSDTELSALLGSLDDVFNRALTTATVIRIALLTACRRGEIALARWSHLDLDSNAPTWTVPKENSKTGVPYLTPLTADAVKEFRTLKRRAGRSPFVLPAVDGIGSLDAKLLTRSVARHLKRLGKLGIAEFTLHDLRRTVRTGLSRLRVQPHIAERCLNHMQSGIAAVYDVHDYQDEKREAFERWAAHLRALMKG